MKPISYPTKTLKDSSCVANSAADSLLESKSKRSNQEFIRPPQTPNSLNKDKNSASKIFSLATALMPSSKDNSLRKADQDNSPCALDALSVHFPAYHSIDGGDLLQFFSEFPSSDHEFNEIAAQRMFLALATAPRIEMTVSIETSPTIHRLQRIFTDGTFDKYIDNTEFSLDINDSYAHAARQLMSVPLSSTADDLVFLTLEKPLPCSEPHLIGYEIEMGANFHEQGLPPHFVLAKTLVCPNLGWPALSFQIDRMPGRAPHIEIVTGPLDVETRKSPDYFNAISSAKQCIAESKSLDELIERYNSAVGKKFRIELSQFARDFLEDGGSLSYDLVFPNNPGLIVRNVQTTIQVPYFGFVGDNADIDRILLNDRELSRLLSESRKFATTLLSDVSFESAPEVRQRCGSVFVHMAFELLTNLAVGRAGSFDFKSKAALIVRTPPEVIAPYLCGPDVKPVLRSMISDRGRLVNWAQTTLLQNAKNAQSERFLTGAGIAELKTLIYDKCSEIEQRLAISDKVGSYLATSSGNVMGDKGAVSWVKPIMCQTRNLPPTICHGDLFVAVELRNRRSFAGFHHSYKGVAQLRAEKPV